MITHQEIAAGADEGLQAALLMSFYHQTGGSAQTFLQSVTTIFLKLNYVRELVLTTIRW